MAQTNMVGYHGTLENRAESILQAQKFYISRKRTEWLGSGSYFFKHSTHAQIWASHEARKPQNSGQRPAVLKAHLQCDDSQIFDLDDPKNLYALNDFIEAYFKRVGTELCVSFKNSEESVKWCLSCNLYRRLHADIAITMYTFTDLAKPKFSGFRTNQTQLCVSETQQDTIKAIEKWKA